MKKILVLLLTNCLLPVAYCQLTYWQQKVNYTIDVLLNDKEHTLDGFEKIEYTNNSPDTLYFIWFHLWPNAYKNDKTAFSDQALENGNIKFYFSKKEQKGYINRLDFKVNNIIAETEDHPEHIDVIKLILPSALAPGQTIHISTPFHVKLPYTFSRSGYNGDSYQITQWYPKPAVYDVNGWHPIPYLDQGEFYSEFGSFDVQITVPENYVVAATGELQNAEEKEWLKTRRNFSWKAVSKKIKTKSGITKTIKQFFPASAKETKTIHYKQNNVHDFAWFSDKRFIVKQDTCLLASGRIVNISAYYTAKHSNSWNNAIQYSKDAIRFYSNEVGEYPFNTASVVQIENYGGGMEYPTITAISPQSNNKLLDYVIAHELGHNWFYGILASNERIHPWMDEGLNTFYADKYAREKYNNFTVLTLENLLLETKEITKTDQPIETPSEKFSNANYNLVAYEKTAEWLRWMEKSSGKEKLKAAMQHYFTEWQFRHPQPTDFKNSIEKNIGQNSDSLFPYLNKTGTLPYNRKKGTGVASIFQIKRFTGQNNLSAKKNIISIGPSVAFNSYDKLMVGGLVTNYNLPPTKFKFFLAPMYATGSKQFTGLGTAHYTFYPDNNLFRSIDLFANGAKFSSDIFADSASKKTYLGFIKFVHGFKITLKEKDPRSTMYRFIQWKTCWFNEDGLQFSRDTIINGTDTSVLNSYKKITDSRTLRQLRIVIENNRALYPYNGELKLEYTGDFIRTAFTGNYFFNYAKAGGLNVRLFAGKFFYRGGKTTSKQFDTDRYHLNMTGANGYEDYTYSDYFIGRNKFDGMASQQIMLRDGGFKTRTDLLANKIGKTDDWLVAVNFTTSLPGVNLPLRLFADIGTYSDAWKKNSGLDHFLFEAGIQVSLLKEAINVYLPLIYSNELKSYIQSYLPKDNRFLKTISFAIDIANFTLRKIDRNIIF